MDFYWNHYAKVMEYNRQRMLMQNPSKMSIFDISIESKKPTAQICNFSNFNHLKRGRQRALNNFNTSSCTLMSENQVLKGKANGKRKGKKARKRQRRLERCAISQNNRNQSDNEESQGESMLEFVIDDDFMKFLEISMEHKLERKKNMLAEQHRESLKREEQLSQGTYLAGVQHQERKAYKQQLYGENGDKIIAMENAMNISFNQQKDLHQPVLWPSLALNLKF